MGDRLERVAGALDDYQRDRSWVGFPLAALKKFGDDRAGNLAALIAYYGFFSLFALLLGGDVRRRSPAARRERGVRHVRGRDRARTEPERVDVEIETDGRRRDISGTRR